MICCSRPFFSGEAGGGGYARAGASCATDDSGLRFLIWASEAGLVVCRRRKNRAISTKAERSAFREDHMVVNRVGVETKSKVWCVSATRLRFYDTDDETRVGLFATSCRNIKEFESVRYVFLSH